MTSQSQPTALSNSHDFFSNFERNSKQLLEKFNNRKSQKPLNGSDADEEFREALTLIQDLGKELHGFFAMTGMMDRYIANKGKMAIYIKPTHETRIYLITFYKALYFCIQSFELGKLGILKTNPEVTQGPIAGMIKFLLKTINVVSDVLNLASPVAKLLVGFLNFFLKRRAEKAYNLLEETTIRMSLNHSNFLTSSEVESVCLQAAIYIIDDSEKQEEICSPSILLGKPKTNNQTYPFFKELYVLYQGYVFDHHINKFFNPHDRKLNAQEELAFRDVYLLFVYLSLNSSELLSEGKSMDKIFTEIILEKRWNEHKIPVTSHDKYKEVLSRLTKRKWYAPWKSSK